MFKSKLTTIVAITALVIAVFGATPLGQAAGRLVLRKNSVGASQLKKSAVSSKKLATNAVSGAKIAKDAVTGAKVKDDTLLAADFKAVGLSGYQRVNSAWTPHRARRRGDGLRHLPERQAGARRWNGDVACR